MLEVLQILDGSPVSEVAIRYGVSRQSVCAWKDPYATIGVITAEHVGWYNSKRRVPSDTSHGPNRSRLLLSQTQSQPVAGAST